MKGFSYTCKLGHEAVDFQAADLATDGLHILTVRMTDTQCTRMEGKSSYVLSRALS